MIIDLHTHTDKSDGELSPFSLLDRARENGVSVISIADHDTLGAYDQGVISYAEKIGIMLVPGVEISTVDERGRKWHILGHFVDPFDLGLRSWLESLRQARKTYAKEMIEKLGAIGWQLDEGRLLQFDVISKAHIADAVIDYPSNQSALKKQFDGHMPSRGEFIESTMNKGCPAYIRRIKSPTPTEAIDVIRRAGGVASVAHPIAAIYEQNLTFEEIAETIKTFAPDGIEAYYYYFSKSRGDRKFEMVHEFVDLAKQLDIVPVGGSDFHGVSEKLGNFVDVGMISEDYAMTEEQLALQWPKHKLYLQL